MRQMFHLAGKPDGLGWWAAGCMSLALLAVCVAAMPVQWLMSKRRKQS